jgi:hypothetical protein
MSKVSGIAKPGSLLAIMGLRFVPSAVFINAYLKEQLKF